MITAKVRLVSSMWFRLSDAPSNTVADELLVYDLRPLEELDGDEQIVDDEAMVGVVIMIDFDGLLYRLTVENQIFANTRAIVEDIITSQRATAHFDEDGVMLTISVSKMTYDIASVELIGPSGAIESAEDGEVEGFK